MSAQAVLPLAPAPERHAQRVQIDYAGGKWLVWTPHDKALLCRQVDNLPDLLRLLGDDLPDFAADKAAV